MTQVAYKHRGGPTDHRDKRWLVDRAREGMDVRDQGEEAGVCADTVRYHRRRHGLDPEYRTPEDLRLCDPRWLACHVIRDGCDGVAEDLGVTPRTVRMWKRRLVPWLDLRGRLRLADLPADMTVYASADGNRAHLFPGCITNTRVRRAGEISTQVSLCKRCIGVDDDFHHRVLHAVGGVGPWEDYA
ncbi:hypothetical protein [Salinigranum halophilum]|uniref:hypothetical protein n=1 Tax=Salinigranum halophilum TaxID=2565931 RepID=UPI0010A7A695|nr:hypothetical protein [Salinigranum halophilum]